MAGADDLEDGDGEAADASRLDVGFALEPSAVRSAGSSAPAIAFLPDRYCPVSDALRACDLAPACRAATISPPRSPAPGPKSSRWSARGDHFAVVLDHEQRVAEVAELAAAPRAAGALSRGCRPIVGSSSTYSTPVRPLPTWLARRMRCDLAAGERRRRAAEREVVEADVDQELQPVAISRSSSPATCCSRLVELQLLEERAASRRAAAAQLVERAGRGTGRPPRRRAAGCRRRSEQATSPTRWSSRWR